MSITETPTDIVYLRNTKGGEVVYEGGQGTNRYAYRWAGADDPEGGDIQGVARHLLSDPNMRRTMTNGVLVTVTDAEAEQAFQKQATAYQNRVNITGPAAVAQHMQQTPDLANVQINEQGQVANTQVAPQQQPLAHPAPAGLSEPSAPQAQPNLGDTDLPAGGVVNVTEDGAIDDGPIEIRVTEGPPLSNGL